MGAAAVPLALTSVGLSVYQQERQASAQRKAMREQAKVQKQQAAQAQAEQRRAAVEERAANQKSPDIARLLAGAQDENRSGVAGSMLAEDEARRLGGRRTLLG